MTALEIRPALTVVKITSLRQVLLPDLFSNSEIVAPKYFGEDEGLFLGENLAVSPLFHKSEWTESL